MNFSVDVKCGKQPKVNVYAEKDVYVLSKKNESVNVETNFVSKEELKAPLKKGDKIGVLEVYKNSVLIDSVNVLVLEDVYEKTYLDYLKNVLDNWAIVGN